MTAPTALAKSRVMARAGLSEQDFDARNSMQMPQEDKIKMADIIIKNDEKSPLIPRIIALHKQLIQ